MKKLLTCRTAVILGFVAAAAIWPVRLDAAENVINTLDILRSTYAADREAIVAEAMQLTATEETAFWPLYRQYRTEKEKIGDELVKLVLEYADVYPNVPEERARELLKRYSSLEKKLSSLRTSHLKKFGKALPTSKTLRFAQLENRMDLVLRLQLASRIPLLPIEGRLRADSAATVVTAEGVPGGVIVQTHELTATVIAVQKASRKVTLLGTGGIKETIQVGPDVVNFDQIRVGDRLKVEVTQELIVGLAAPGESSEELSAAVVALAPEGAKPGGIMAETTQLTATIKEIDREKRTATLQFDDGSSRVFPVRKDVDLGKRKVGEKVVFSATGMVALSVQKP